MLLMSKIIFFKKKLPHKIPYKLNHENIIHVLKIHHLTSNHVHVMADEKKLDNHLVGGSVIKFRN
jgi:hypothetical protein